MTDLARWQFATTSIYHFLFVPVTIGLAFLTAVLQTTWHRSGNPELRRLTRFFGVLLVINVAVGVVTGPVQEFVVGQVGAHGHDRGGGRVPATGPALPGLVISRVPGAGRARKAARRSAAPRGGSYG